MKRLISFLLLSVGLFGADAANDLILTQRKADNSGNIQRNVAPVTNGFLTFNGSKVPTSPDITYSSPTFGTPDGFTVSSAGSIALTAGGTNKNITLAPSGTGGTAGAVVNSTGVHRTGQSFMVFWGTSGSDLSSTATSYFVQSLNTLFEIGGTNGSTLSVRSGVNTTPGRISATNYASSGSAIIIDANGASAGGTFLGQSTNSMLRIYNSGAAAGGLALGTTTSAPVYLGTNNTLAATITTGQNLTLSNGATNYLTFVGSSGASAITGGAGNMTITAGTGNSRTLTLQTTTSGGTATNAVVFSDTQSASFNGPVIQKTASLTYAAPTSVDVTLANVYTVTTVNATGSVTFNATAGGTAGQSMTVIVTNDATSAKTITFGTNFVANGTLTPSGVNKVATIEFMSNGTSFYEVSRTVLP